MSGHCLVCLRSGPFDSRNGFCDACGPVARQHVVSMQIDQATGDYRAICPCGWQDRQPRTHAGALNRDVMVVEHWRAVVAEAAGT